MILKVLNPFGGDHRIETLFGPGKPGVQIYFPKRGSEMQRRFGINVRTNGIESLLLQSASQRSISAARCVENSRARRQA